MVDDADTRVFEHAATFRDIAGLAPAAPPVDGRSFLPLLHGQSIPWRTQFLLSRGQTKPYRGIRHTDGWAFGQLITPAPYEVPGEYYGGLDGSGNDRFELFNGYLDLAAQRLADLQALSANFSQCAGDSCRVYDSQVI